jgi:hypothetical protein
MIREVYGRSRNPSEKMKPNNENVAEFAHLLCYSVA